MAAILLVWLQLQLVPLLQLQQPMSPVGSWVLRSSEMRGDAVRLSVGWR